MTRQERAKAREARSRRKVLNAITGLMSKMYKQSSGAWHIEQIAKDTNLHRNTVSKYIKEYEELNII